MDSSCDKMNIVLPTVSCGKKCRNQKIVVRPQNNCSQGKNKRIGSPVVPYRTLAK
jgi:hypothetical protein